MCTSPARPCIQDCVTSTGVRKSHALRVRRSSGPYVATCKHTCEVQTICTDWLTSAGLSCPSGATCSDRSSHQWAQWHSGRYTRMVSCQVA
jgi:hypothetical protein